MSAVLRAAHDASSRVGFALAAALLALITLSYTYEVCARYFFNAPTEWASTFVAHALLVSVFLGMPELTRQNAHVCVNVLTEAARPAVARVLQIATHSVAALACFGAAWFCADETIGQFRGGVWTAPPLAMPKWALSAVIPLAFFSAGLYFVRHIARRPPAEEPGAPGDTL